MQKLKEDTIHQITLAPNLEALETIRVNIFGKQGIITEKMKSLAALSVEEKKTVGAQINVVKTQILEVLDKAKKVFEEKELHERLMGETIDATLPGRQLRSGKIHPISHTISQIYQIFGDMGFKLAQGPDIEDDFHNFTALNIGPMHPARQEQDTFYLNSEKLLRTQTSGVQIRTMMTQKPPLRIIAPGRTFRSDSDQTHTPMFHQVEGLVIEENIHMGHLKGCLLDFLKKFFDAPDLKLRFRPSYFPFTEPSAEVDIRCDRRDGKLKIGQGDDWLEILGCGMVHPKVLENCNIDPKTHQGFAFGMGIERLAMLKYSVPDLRMFYESDIKWLDHYGFSPFEV